MGSYLSTPTTTLNDEIAPVVEYLCGKYNETLSVDPDVKVVVKRSKLHSAFIEGRHMGLFTKNAITKGTILFSVNDEQECKMNDAVTDLEPILVADTSEKTYQA